MFETLVDLDRSRAPTIAVGNSPEAGREDYVIVRMIPKAGSLLTRRGLANLALNPSHYVSVGADQRQLILLQHTPTLARIGTGSTVCPIIRIFIPFCSGCQYQGPLPIITFDSPLAHQRHPGARLAYVP